MKDKRKTYNDTRITGSNVWTFDGKYDPGTNTLKIYHLRGDITDMAAFRSALEKWAAKELNEDVEFEIR